MHMRAVKHTIRGGLCTHHAAWVNHTENRCQSGKTRNLHVIGVLEDTAFFAPGVTSSRATVDDLAGSPLPAQSYQFRLADEVDSVAVAKDLEKAFAQNGLQAVAIKKEIEDGSTSQGLFNNLLMGFMGLGL